MDGRSCSPLLSPRRSRRTRLTSDRRLPFACRSRRTRVQTGFLTSPPDCIPPHSMDDVIRLPFEARLLLPFVVACRAVPSCLDARARHEHIARVMRAHDSTFTSQLAKAAEEALALSLDDLMQKVDAGRDVHGPDDRTCVCCGSTEMVTSFTRSSTEYTLHAKRWRSCRGSASGALPNIRPVLLVSHPKPSKMRGLKAQLEATLRIPVRVRPDPTPSICLVRGFDSVPVSFAMSEKLSSDGASLAPMGPRLHLLHLLQLGVRKRTRARATLSTR